jgi:hypothetical protein
VATVGNVNEILDGHIVLDLECLDRVYLNAYIPKLQVSGQVVTFFSQHRNQPIASPALIQKMGESFRLAVANYAKRHQIPVIRFGKRDRQIDVIQPYFKAATQPGVVAIGVAQEFQSVLTGYDRSAKKGEPRPGGPHYSFVKEDRRVTVYYFYIADAEFGLGFIKLCAYFPNPAKCGRMDMSGPSGRRLPKVSPSLSWPMASLLALTLPACRPSVIGSVRPTCRPSLIAG